ncbi:MAG: hypothetical protein BHV75_12575 [Bacteroides oleiciplenus]|nr:MAG: hypothetical protein BHV75_12575 [Bacteroides oleiciplenus]
MALLFDFTKKGISGQNINKQNDFLSVQNDGGKINRFFPPGFSQYKKLSITSHNEQKATKSLLFPTEPSLQSVQTEFNRIIFRI